MKMANLTPQRMMERLKTQGLLLVKEGKYFFIPTDEMAQFELPAEFQNLAKKISKDYFEETGTAPADFDPESAVFRGIDRALSRANMVDGVEQAVMLEKAVTIEDTLVSKSSRSKQVIFVYGDEDKNKIKVDLSKGGRLFGR
jgi:hypothetical protein